MLKKWLIKSFGNKILFVTLEDTSQQVIISDNCLHEQTLPKSFDFCIMLQVKNRNESFTDVMHSVSNRNFLTSKSYQHYKSII